jgi:hypothetical protein
LVDNTGLDSEDYVYITENSLDCEDPETLSDIEILEERGVDLDHDC